MSHDVPHPLVATAAARPAHPVLVHGEQEWTSAALVDRVARRAAALEAGPGDVVALSGPRGADWVVALHAIGWRGAVARPLDPRLSDAARDRLLEGVTHRVGELPDAQPLGASASPVDAAWWSLASPRLEVVTSGTTGAPRIVPLSTQQLLFSAMASALRLGHLPSDRWIATLPLHHVGGLSILFRCAWYGTTVELHERFDPTAVNRSLDGGSTHVSLVPVMLDRLLDDRGDRPFGAHVRCLLVGGAPTTEAQRRRAAAAGAPVALTWGMTEAASQIATGFPGTFHPQLPTLPFLEVTSEEGQLRVRGPVVHGRLTTADRGRVEAGHVHVVGRVDDVVLSGGENIDPAEVEAVLAAHPSVAEAAVAGQPHPRWGARPHAWLVPEPGVPAPADGELFAWCRARLEPFKCPDELHWVAALPRNELGKVVRRRLEPVGGE